MSKRLSTGRVRATYEFIKTHRHEYSVHTMCRLLEVAPSGYYDWLKQPTSKRAQEDARLLRLIQASFIASQGIYGAPRVFLDLREAGESCSKHRVERLMRLNGLRALHGYRTRRWSVGMRSTNAACSEVMTMAGATTLKVMPYSANSRASPGVTPWTPPFAALYTACCQSPLRTDSAPILTTRP